MPVVFDEVEAQVQPPPEQAPEETAPPSMPESFNQKLNPFDLQREWRYWEQRQARLRAD